MSITVRVIRVATACLGNSKSTGQSFFSFEAQLQLSQYAVSEVSYLK